MDPLGAHGEFILDYSVYDAVFCGYDKIVFVIKRETEELFRKTIGERTEKRVKTEYVFQVSHFVTIIRFIQFLAFCSNISLYHSAVLLVHRWG